MCDEVIGGGIGNSVSSGEGREGEPKCMNGDIPMPRCA